MTTTQEKPVRNSSDIEDHFVLKKRYLCRYCGHTFKLAYRAWEHLEKEHTETIYVKTT